MTYTELLALTGKDFCLQEEPPPGPDSLPAEMEIQSLWFSGHLGSHFTSTDGRNIEIISPGEWNRGAGPDFLRGSIILDGKAHHGPIEIDLATESWETHGHSTNPDFDEVILHLVVLESGKGFFTRSSAHREIPRAVIPITTIQEALGRPRLTNALARSGRCQPPLAHLNEESCNRLLGQAALHRASFKAARIQRCADRHSQSQALWECFSESLGYSQNSFPLKLLAQRIPIHQLSVHPPGEIEAILFGVAGFLHPNLHEKAPADSREWLEDLWKIWWKLRPQYEFSPERTLPWSNKSTRPANHPHRRLAALALAGSRWKSLAALARQAAPFTAFQNSLLSLSHPFWDHHHTLTSQPGAKPLALLGKSRIQEFLVNTLYPLALDSEKETTFPHYQKVRTSAPNQKVKRCAERLFGSLESAKPHLKKTWQHQALLQIYQDFCLNDLSDCQDCPFPEQLWQWE